MSTTAFSLALPYTRCPPQNRRQGVHDGDLRLHPRPRRAVFVHLARQGGGAVGGRLVGVAHAHADLGGRRERLPRHAQGGTRGAPAALAPAAGQGEGTRSPDSEGAAGRRVLHGGMAGWLQDQGEEQESVIRKFPIIPFLNFKLALTTSSFLKLFTMFDENEETECISPKINLK